MSIFRAHLDSDGLNIAMRWEELTPTEPWGHSHSQIAESLLLPMKKFADLEFIWNLFL